MFHSERSERGFTLVELLVVILIIAVLSAIAIPVFLGQREKAWETQLRSSLKNAATMEDSYLTTAGSYTDSVDNLRAQGYRDLADVTLSVPRFDAAREFCLEAAHSSSGSVWHLDSNIGVPSTGSC